MLRRLLHYTEVDHAVIFALLTRAWQAMAGLVTLLLIARCFTPELQGYYYTFFSLLALQSFVELGFCLVITNVASHEWAHLGLDSAGRIIGQPEALSRLVSLGRLIFKWYAVASTVFIIGVSLIGYIFFSRSFSSSEIQWKPPWLVLVSVTGLILWTLPYQSLLEGCNQVGTVNRFRLKQAVLANATMWLAMALNGGLWVTVAYAGMNLLSNLYLLLIRYRHFFARFFQPPSQGSICWKKEIWPMQGRIAVSGLVNYFAFSLFNPVMFRYYGAAVAGQMGMTLQVVYAVQTLGLAWVATKVPRFGILIAQKEYSSLDRLWQRSLMGSLLFVSLAAGGGWLVIYGLNIFKVSLAQRLLSPLPVALFLLAVLLLQFSQCLSAYLRAHKQEPIMVMSVVCSLGIGLLVWLLGRRFGPIGAAGSYLAMMMVTVIWETLIWRECRVQWHKI